ncbi:hypothetical protein V8E36_003531 [Tilletia maclaganii]
MRLADAFDLGHGLELDGVEAFNVVLTLVITAIIVASLLVALWRSTFRTVRLDDAHKLEAPTTTFDLSGFTLNEQKAAVSAAHARYRGVAIDEGGYKKAVRWRIQLLAVLSTAVIVIDGFWLVLGGQGTLRHGCRLAIVVDIVLWVVLLGITLLPLRTQKGWAHVSQLAALTTVTASTHVLRVLIPANFDSTGFLASERRAADFTGTLGKDLALPPVNHFRVAAMLLSLVAFGTTLTLPSGPRRVFAASLGEEEDLPMIRDQDAGASIFTILYAGWCTPLMLKAHRQGSISETDVPVLGVSMRAAVLHARMTLRNRSQGKLTKETSSSQKAWRLFGSLLRTNDQLLVIVLLTEFIGSVLAYLPPYLLWKIVNTMEESEAQGEPRALSFRRNLVYIVTFFVGQLLQMYSSSIAQMTAAATLKNRIKAQLNTLLLSKALRRKDFTSAAKPRTPAEGAGGVVDDTTSRRGRNSGGGKRVEEGDIDISSRSKVIALHTIDVQRVLELVQSSFSIISSPVEIVTGSVLLFRLLGIGGFIGLAMAVVPVPLVYLVGKMQTARQVALMNARDARTAALSEGTQAIRMVKLGAWESRVTARILDARETELKYMRLLFSLQVIIRLIGELSTILIVLVAFAWSTLVEGRALTPGIAFASFVVLKKLRRSIEFLPQTVTESIQSFVSLRRVAVYLDSPEIDPPPRESLDDASNEPSDAAPPVVLDHVTVGWPVFAGFGATGPPTPSDFYLRELSISFVPGKLNLICGRVGSGKTLLLLSLLSEVEILSGRVYCPRSPADAIIQSDVAQILQPERWISSKLVAYAPQQAVIVNGSIRLNILWDLRLNQERYDATLHACGLLPDLAAFEDGDRTEVGEGGIGLSGGQKARIGLARAVYSRAQTLLLDDVLSAVDAHTAVFIHRELLQGPLLEDRTVLLVSHQVQLVASSAALVVLLADGQLRFKGDSAQFLASRYYTGLLEKSRSPDTLAAETTSTARASPSSGRNADTASKESIRKGSEARKGSHTSATKAAPKQPRKLVEEEKRERGTIAPKVWKAYFRAAGGARIVVPTALMIIICELWVIVPAGWLAAMTADTTRRESGSTHSLAWWLQGYALLSIGGAIVNNSRFLFVFFLALFACRQIFERALVTLFASPLRFFDMTPRGRIMSRFGSDVQLVDEQLSWPLGHISGRSVAFFLSCVVVSVKGSPLFLLVVALLAPAYNWVSIHLRVVVRDVRRLGQTSKSPVVQTFSDVLAGLAVIRAFGSVETTMQTFYQRLDHNIRFDNLQLYRWSGTAMGTFSAIQLFVAACFIASKDGTLSFLLDLGGQIQTIVSTIGRLEYCMVAVERLTEFADLPIEAPEIVEPRPPTSWPQHGEVAFKDVRVRYAPELPDVLRGVSFKVEGGRKVGIVGATGSGKSTAVNSLFRFVELAGGSIEIDGIDISKIGLKDLRSRIHIVPQDPVILSGSLRDAVDMFHQHTDAEILAALTKVHLITPPCSKLDRRVPDGEAAAWTENGDMRKASISPSASPRAARTCRTDNASWSA